MAKAQRESMRAKKNNVHNNGVKRRGDAKKRKSGTRAWDRKEVRGITLCYLQQLLDFLRSTRREGRAVVRVTNALGP